MRQETERPIPQKERNIFTFETYEKPMPYLTELFNVLEQYIPGSTEKILSVHTYDHAYLRWQYNRLKATTSGTGFEGYYVGTKMNPRDIASHQAKIAQGLLDSDVRLHPFDVNRRNVMIATLLQGKVTGIERHIELTQLFNDLRGWIGSTIATVPGGYQQFDSYRSFVRGLIQKTPDIKFSFNKKLPFRQLYQIPCVAPGQKITEANAQDISPKYQDGWAILSRIGIMGQPIMRLIADSKAIEFALKGKIGQRRGVNFAWKGSRLWKIQNERLLDTLQTELLTITSHKTI